MPDTRIAFETFLFIIVGLSLLAYYEKLNSIPLNPFLTRVLVLLTIINKILLITLPSVLCIYFIYIYRMEENVKKLCFFVKPIKHFQGECSICLGDHNDNDAFTKINKCNHIFHTKCINEWIMKCNKYTCPLCRTCLG